MLVGIEQYDRSLFKAAGQSFRRAAAYRKYLTDPEQQKLDELKEKAGNARLAKELTPADVRTTDRLVRPALPAKVKTLCDRSVPVIPPVKAEVPADSVKDGKLLTEKEWEYIVKSPLTADNSLREYRRIKIKPAPSSATRESAEAAPSTQIVFQPGDVVARPYYNHRVFVGGQVVKPGVVQIPGEMTPLKAIMEVGGFNPRTAERKNVIVIRYANGRRYAYKLDLKRTAAGNDGKPFYLQPKDIVHVPRTKIERLNPWIDRHINEIIPDTEFFLTKTSRDATVGVGSYR